MAETQGIVIPSGSGEVQIVMNSANAAPAVVFQTRAQNQQAPSYSYQQTTQQHLVYHQHPPQVPGYQHPSPQVPGYQHPSPQVPGYQHRPSPQVPGYHQHPPQVPGYQHPSPQVPGYQHPSPQVPGYQHPYQPPPYQQSYLPPPQHVNAQQQLHYPPPLTEPSHDSHRPVSSQPSRVAQRPPRHDNNTPSRDESNSEKCCKDCCDKSSCCKDCCGKNASVIWAWILLAIVCFPVTLLILPFVIGYYLCCKDENCCEEENCNWCADCFGKIAAEYCALIILAIICFPITILFLPCLALLFCCSEG